MFSTMAVLSRRKFSKTQIYNTLIIISDQYEYFLPLFARLKKNIQNRFIDFDNLW